MDAYPAPAWGGAYPAASGHSGPPTDPIGWALGTGGTGTWALDAALRQL